MLVSALSSQCGDISPFSLRIVQEGLYKEKGSIRCPGGEPATHFQGEVVKVGRRSGIRAGGHRKVWQHRLVFILRNLKREDRIIESMPAREAQPKPSLFV